MVIHQHVPGTFTESAGYPLVAALTFSPKLITRRQKGWVTVRKPRRLPAKDLAKPANRLLMDTREHERREQLTAAGWMVGNNVLTRAKWIPIKKKKTATEVDGSEKL